MTLPPTAKHCATHGFHSGSVCPLCPRRSIAQEAAALPDEPPPAGISDVIQVNSKNWPSGDDCGRYVKAIAKRSLEAPKLNKTEQRWQDAHPSHVRFPLRLRWGQCMWYKPDFLYKGNPIEGEPNTLIEVKGGWIESRDIVRFKGCAAEWGWLFVFEMHQWEDQKWTRLY